MKGLKRSTLRIFDGFIYSENYSPSFSRFNIGNMASSIRIMARYNSDPAVCIRFLENQKRTHLKTSSFIEICRFLSIFPEYRQLMLDEIKNISSKSMYNRFTLYMFHHLLESLCLTSMPDEYLSCLDSLYFSYLSHSHFYWCARKQHHFFRAYFESLVASLFHHEIRVVVQGLFNLIPSVPLLHKYYADILLNVDGKFDEYKKEVLFSNELEKKHAILDPLLHQMSLTNPKILQFCSQTVNVSGSSSAMNTTFSTARSENSARLFTKFHKKENKNKKSSAASKIIRSKRHIPYFHILHFVFPPLIVLTFAIYCTFIISKIAKKEALISDTLDDIYERFYDLSSSIFIPFATDGLSDLVHDDNCAFLFHNAFELIDSYFLNSPIISYLSNVGIIKSFHIISETKLYQSNICNIVSNMSDIMEINTFESFDLLYNYNQNLVVRVDDFNKCIQLMFSYIDFTIYGTISILAFLCIYFIVTCVTMNSIMKKDPDAIEFLSSDRRLAPIVQDPESREIFWDQLNGLDSSINFSDSSFHVESESDVDQFSTSMASVHQANSSTSSFVQFPPSIKSAKNNNPSNEDNNSPLHSAKNNSELTGSNINLKIPKLQLTHPNFTGSGINITKHQRNVGNRFKPSTTTDDNDRDSLILDSATASARRPSTGTGSDYDGNEMPLFRNKSSARLSSVPKEIDLNSISSFLSDKKKETCIYSFYGIFFLLFPWILLYLCVAFSYFPLSHHRNSASQHLSRYLEAENDFKVSCSLLNVTFLQIVENVTDFDVYSFVNDTYKNEKTEISELYFTQNCYEFIETECYSVSDVVSRITSPECTGDFLISRALPIILTFSEKALKRMNATSGEKDHLSSISPAPSFIAIIIIFFVFFVIQGNVHTRNFKKGLNSLFHYPSSNYNRLKAATYSASATTTNPNLTVNTESSGQKNVKINVDVNINLNANDNNNNNSHSIVSQLTASKDIEKGIKFPSNVMVITSVTETDEIYSISDNCHQIINRKSSDLICRKLSRLFPIVKETDGFEIRDYNGKMLLSKSITIGKLTKTVLIKSSKVEDKNRNSNVIQKLINFMPNCFAKTFSEEFVNTFHFDRSFLIFVRVDSNAPQIDPFFTIINRLDQNYYNIDFIRSNGSVLTCLCKEPDDLEILLFLRDLITSAEESCKKQMKNFALKSIYIDEMEELNIDIVDGDLEPEAFFEESRFTQLEAMAFLIDDHCIGISDESLALLVSISKLTSKKELGSGKYYNFLTFKKFSDDVIKDL